METKINEYIEKLEERNKFLLDYWSNDVNELLALRKRVRELEEEVAETREALSWNQAALEVCEDKLLDTRRELEKHEPKLPLTV